MNSPHLSPIAGDPKTVAGVDRSGNLQFRIALRAQTPLYSKIADKADDWLRFAWLLRCVALLFRFPQFGVIETATSLVMYLIGGVVIKAALRQSLVARTEIQMTTDAVKVRRWFAWRTYSRHLEHGFALRLHDRANEEARDMDIASREAAVKGKVLKQKPYYGESYVVVLIYGGHSIDLMSVYGQQEATAVAARLSYCDRALNESIGMAGGITSKPEDEWTIAPGGI